MYFNRFIKSVDSVLLTNVNTGSNVSRFCFNIQRTNYEGGQKSKYFSGGGLASDSFFPWGRLPPRPCLLVLFITIKKL